MKHVTGKFLLHAAMVASLLLAFACSAPAAEDQDKNWTTAARLIETSDRIVTAQFLDSRVESVQAVDEDTGAISGEADVLFRQFEVIETLKGSTEQGDTLWIGFDPGSDGVLVDGSGEEREFRQTQTYVLFLKGRARPLEYPPDYGAVLWTGNGEPAVAELSGDDLEFLADDVYLQLLLGEGTMLPDNQSAAPFELTLEETRSMAD